MIKEIEIIKKSKKILYTAGLDEAGAGCGAGDLVVAAVILDPEKPIAGLNDSKKLSESKRESLYELIIRDAIDYAIINISPNEIDKINIFNARMLGFKKAIKELKKVEYAIIDGNKIPDGLNITVDFLVKGDEKLECISAASILAKVTRDRLIIEQSKKYNKYDFEKNKGYLTKSHLDALKKYGPCEIHRFSYKPIIDSKK